MRYLSVFLLMFACTEDLPPADPGPDASADTGPSGQGDGTFSLVVNATDDSRFVHLHLEDGLEAAAWDLRFQRFVIGLNGGVSGAGQALAVFVPDATLEAATRAPEDGWRSDAADGADENDTPDLAFDAWYLYNPVNHVLTPKAGVWYVRSGDGMRYYALRIDGYYDDAGTAGHLGLTWKAVEAPAGAPVAPDGGVPDGGVPDAEVPEVPDAEVPDAEVPDAEVPDAEVPAPSEAVAHDVVAPEAWVYVSLRVGEVVQVVDPTTENTWDIAVFRTRLRTNGGTSGVGLGGAYEAALDVATGDPALCMIDTEVPEPGPPGSGTFSGNPVLSAWYDYNPRTHEVTPRPVAFVVCTADGGVARLRISGYGQGVMSLEYTYAGDDTTF